MVCTILAICAGALSTSKPPSYEQKIPPYIEEVARSPTYQGKKSAHSFPLSRLVNPGPVHRQPSPSSSIPTAHILQDYPTSFLIPPPHPFLKTPPSQTLPLFSAVTLSTKFTTTAASKKTASTDGPKRSSNPLCPLMRILLARQWYVTSA